MSFTKLSTLDRYWSKDVLYSFNPVPSAMSSLRFKAILAFLQITPLPDVNKGKVVSSESMLVYRFSLFILNFFMLPSTSLCPENIYE